MCLVCALCHSPGRFITQIKYFPVRRDKFSLEYVQGRLQDASNLSVTRWSNVYLLIQQKLFLCSFFVFREVEKSAFVEHFIWLFLKCMQMTSLHSKTNVHIYLQNVITWLWRGKMTFFQSQDTFSQFVRKASIRVYEHSFAEEKSSFICCLHNL